MKTRIVLVDDHQMLLDAIKILVEPEFDVVATFSDARSFLDALPSLQAEIVVLDVGIPFIDGFSIGTHIKTLHPWIKILFLTMREEKQFAAEAFQLGASGYILKNAAAKELLVAIREVIRGGYYASPSLTEGVTGSFVQSFKKMKPRHELTLRQKEVLSLLCSGLSMKQVAFELNLATRTVAFHKYKMMRELEIESNAELLSFAASYLPGSK